MYGQRAGSEAAVVELQCVNLVKAFYRGYRSTKGTIDAESGRNTTASDETFVIEMTVRFHSPSPILMPTTQLQRAWPMKFEGEAIHRVS